MGSLFGVVRPKISSDITSIIKVEQSLTNSCIKFLACVLISTYFVLFLLSFPNISADKITTFFQLFLEVAPSGYNVGDKEGMD